MNKSLFAFVLMPFDKKFDDIYKLGIQEGAKEVDIKAQRLDEQIFDGNMLEKIYQEIDNADIIIADMSDRNPNVFYEVGYADARNKLILFLTSKEEDIPFDLLHRPHIIYDGSINKLKSELIERLEWAKTEIIKRKTEPILIKVKNRYNSIERTKYSDTAEVNFRLELHNLADKPIPNLHTVFVYTGSSWTIFYDNKLCKNTESEIEPYKIRHIIRPDFNTLPAKDWLPIDIQMKKRVYSEWDKEIRKEKYEISGILRIDVHCESENYKTEEKINLVAEYDDLPF
ncbi:MAG: nucleoside 2-deoxyribosyltransferase [Melioribacteraceae bacterium]|nr:nucleoside 2-deoxyribosyltransferase [Melioribacteraceae bacterium]MCF8395122.1 nucleoside 2-deoxyribosyltransferase [Melioribacteraceae bacterium]MCF8420531.1 nucleoside 2-deoxyribosyltransferase [Melioribacteraceae bacterium]